MANKLIDWLIAQVNHRHASHPVRVTLDQNTSRIKEEVLPSIKSQGWVWGKALVQVVSVEIMSFSEP